MKDESTESAAENTSPPVESQLFGTGQEPQQVAEQPVSLIALWSIATIYPDIATGIVRFTIGMSLIFLAAVVDLTSASLLRRTVGRAMLAKDPSRLVLGRGPWYRPFLPGYWARIKREVPDFFHHQLLRYSALAMYLVALAFLIWAVVLL